MAIPEYRLRRVIHEGLKYRNFNALLHRYRIEEACALLADRQQRHLPILTIALTVGYNSINPFNWLIVGREIAQEKPDQIIVRFWLPFMGPCLGTVLRVARFFAGKKLKITALVDNIIPHEKRLGDRQFARYFVRACDDFVVMSKSVGEEIHASTTCRTRPDRRRSDSSGFRLVGRG